MAEDQRVNSVPNLFDRSDLACVLRRSQETGMLLAFISDETQWSDLVEWSCKQPDERLKSSTLIIHMWDVFCRIMELHRYSYTRQSQEAIPSIYRRRVDEQQNVMACFGQLGLDYICTLDS